MTHSALTDEGFNQAVADLCARDGDLARVVSSWGFPPFWTHEPGFPGIVLAILAQQVSVESAEAAYGNLRSAIGSIVPERFRQLNDAALRSIGFSRQKAAYVRGIAKAVEDQTLDFGALDDLEDDEVRGRLMALKGVGRWTADTYLLFSMRRSDVWPLGDLALEKSIQEVKGLGDTPGDDQSVAIADSWRPWRSVAARILWHSYLCERGR